MTQILIFIYALIIFHFVFVTETNETNEASEGILFFAPFSIYLIHNILSHFNNFIYFKKISNAEKIKKIPCFTVLDCPTVLYYLSKCVRYVCVYF